MPGWSKTVTPPFVGRDGVVSRSTHDHQASAHRLRLIEADWVAVNESGSKIATTAGIPVRSGTGFTIAPRGIGGFPLMVSIP
jgi:hypothetical protein